MATMVEKIMASIAGMNKLDRTNDYFIDVDEDRH